METIKGKLLTALSIVMLFTNSITAQGDSCGNAIPMPYSANSALTNITQIKGAYWFTFVPLTTEIKITLTNNSLPASHIHDLILVEGFCIKYFAIGHDESDTDTTLTIQVHDLVVGMPYFIVTVRERPNCIECCTAAGCSAPTANFNLQVQSLPPPIITIDTNNVVYLNGVPSHVKNQVIMRINKINLKMNNVDNLSQQDKPIPVFVNPPLIQKIADQIYNGDVIGLGHLHLKKVFPTMTSADSLSISRDGQIIHVPYFYETFIFTIPDTMSVFKSSRALSDIHGIQYAEPNYVATLANVPNDPFCATNQASLIPTTTYPSSNINVDGAWDIETGKSFVKVGVYDSGIDQTNSDLSGGKVGGGYDYYSGAALPGGNDDWFGHGTSCAGIIGAYRNNNILVAGIAGGDVAAGNNGCTLYDMRIFGGGLAPLSAIAQAIHTGATSTGAGGYELHIMSNSWESQTSTTTLHDAVQYAVQNGVIFCAARGNYPDYGITSIDEPLYPSCYPDEMVINVGASGINRKWKTVGNGNLSDANDNGYYSMIKHNVDVIAPGTNAIVYTTNNTNSYWSFGGTSAACPHVAGVAALMLSHVDQTTPATNNLVIEDVENILQMTANNRETPGGYDDNNGWGLIDATTAMNKIKLPAYKIQHFGVGQNATNPPPTYALQNIHGQLTIQLFSPYGSLPQGTYLVDKYLVTITLNYSLSSPNDAILSYWPRFSSTIGWDNSDAFVKDNWCQIVSVTNTQAVLQTYIYNFFANADGTPMHDPWLPTQSPKAALSIYTYDATLAGINEVNNNNSSLMAVYPNPANNSSMITVSLTRSQQVSLELYDTQGSLIKTVIKGNVSEGKNQYQVSLSDIADGVYFYRLITEDGICEKKLIVIK
ncbi:MAG: S8 family serine peptidase [Bacteroidia bacterium]